MGPSDAIGPGSTVDRERSCKCRREREQPLAGRSVENGEPRPVRRPGPPARGGSGRDAPARSTSSLPHSPTSRSPEVEPAGGRSASAASGGSGPPSRGGQSRGRRSRGRRSRGRRSARSTARSGPDRGGKSVSVTSERRAGRRKSTMRAEPISLVSDPRCRAPVRPASVSSEGAPVGARSGEAARVDDCPARRTPPTPVAPRRPRPEEVPDADSHPRPCPAAERGRPRSEGPSPIRGAAGRRPAVAPATVRRSPRTSGSEPGLGEGVGGRAALVQVGAHGAGAREWRGHHATRSARPSSAGRRTGRTT